MLGKCELGMDWYVSTPTRLGPEDSHAFAQHPTLDDDTVRTVVADWRHPLLAQDTTSGHYFHWYLCPNGHEYQAQPRHAWRGCAHSTCVQPGINDLATMIDGEAPAAPRKWSPRNEIGPDQVKPTGERLFWWVCPNGHQELAPMKERLRACGCQDQTMTKRRLLHLLRAIRDNLDGMDTAELYAALSALKTSKYRVRAAEWIEDPNKGVLDRWIAELDKPTHGPRGGETPLIELTPEVPEDGDGPLNGDDEDAGHPGSMATAVEPERTDDDVKPEDAGHELPVYDVKKVVTGAGFIGLAPEDQIEFLIEKRVHQLRLAMYDAYDRGDTDPVRRATLEGFQSIRDDLATEENYYRVEVATRFLREHDEALEFCAPTGWSFRPEGHEIVAPNMMQRNVACRVQRTRYVGNWSGMGSGKTAAAILSYMNLRTSGANGIAVVICPNRTIDTWRRQILNCYPGSEVEDKTFEPKWETTGPRWLLINFDKLRDRNHDDIQNLVSSQDIAFLVADEVHFAKQRGDRIPSQQRLNLLYLRQQVGIQHPDAAVLGMTGTPSVNDLSEVKSLLEIVWADKAPFALHDLKTQMGRHALANGMAMHQALVRSGVRWQPTYPIEIVHDHPQIDGTPYYDDLVRTPWTTANPADCEAKLLPIKLDRIVTTCTANAKLGRKTVVYSHHVTGIAEPLRDALEQAGLKVAMFFGTTRDDLDQFTDITRADSADVLLGGRMIGTGIDGLQRVCSDMIFLSLPFTHAEYTQTIARLVRQGQHDSEVRITVPMVTVLGPNGVMAYDAYRYSMVDNKRTISDLVVDGVIPDFNEITEAEVRAAFDAELGAIVAA